MHHWWPDRGFAVVQLLVGRVFASVVVQPQICGGCSCVVSVRLCPGCWAGSGSPPGDHSPQKQYGHRQHHGADTTLRTVCFLLFSDCYKCIQLRVWEPASLGCRALPESVTRGDAGVGSVPSLGWGNTAPRCSCSLGSILPRPKKGACRFELLSYSRNPKHPGTLDAPSPRP